MLYVIAVNARGAAGASMVWRDDDEGRLLRVGEHPTCDMRLSGAGIATCDLWYESKAWRIRRPDGSVGMARDGDSIVVGQWMVLVLLGGGVSEESSGVRPSWDATAAVTAGVPWLESDGRRIVEFRDGLPVMIGSGAWCAAHVPWTRESVTAVVRREGRQTRCYPIAGTTLSRNGVRVTERVELADGDVLGLHDAPAMRYVNPDEEIDRLLGLLRSESPEGRDEPPPGVDASAARRVRVVDKRSDAPVTYWEAALAFGTLVAVIAQSVVTVVRW